MVPLMSSVVMEDVIMDKMAQVHLVILETADLKLTVVTEARDGLVGLVLVTLVLMDY